MKYSSNASWTKIKDTKDIGCNTSKDFAQGVCDGLISNYGTDTEGCEVRGHCTKTWVELEKENKK